MKKNLLAAAEVATLFEYFNEIGIIGQLSSNLFERTLPAGLSNSQFRVLNWFSRVDDEATPGRLAKAFQVTGGAMTYTLKKLEDKGLVKVQPDATSGRKKRVTITRKGKLMREKAISCAAPMFEELAEAFAPAKLEKQLKDLQKIRLFLDERRYQS